MKCPVLIFVFTALLLLPSMAGSVPINVDESPQVRQAGLFSLGQAAQAPSEGELDPERPQGTGLRGIVPLLLMVGIYLLLRRLFRSRHGGMRGPFDMNEGPDDSRSVDPRSVQRPEDDPEHLRDAYDNARRTWDAFTAKPGQDVPAGEPRPAGYEPRSESEDGQPDVIDVEAVPREQAVPEGRAEAPAHEKGPQEQIPGDFDEAEFLAGARLVFERMVEAMDALDPAMAEQFAAPEVVNEIKHRMNQGHPPAESEVMRVEAKIMERTAIGGRASVSVYYDALKKVSGLGAVSMRQIWKFTKDNNDPAAMWMLQSMEPVEA